MLSLRALVALALLGALTARAQEFAVDKSHSNIGFSVKHLKVSNTVGRFTDFDGKWQYDAASKSLKSMEGTVKTASIDTGNAKRDGHLRNADFFNVEKFADMKFRLLRHHPNGKLTGELTISSVKKTIILDAKVSDVVVNPLDGGKTKRIGIALSGTIDRRDFGIGSKYPDKIISDDVMIRLEFEGIAPNK